MILDEQTIKTKLQAVQGWEFASNNIRKTYRFPDFVTGLKLVNTVGLIAENLQHHPDITLKFGEVGFVLATHDQGGVTDKDIALAKEIEKSAALLVASADEQ